MTEDGSNVYDVNINKINLVAKTEESGIRVTELVKPNTKVTGSGSRNNPWVFIRKFKVEFNGNTADSGKMDPIICDFGNDCALPKMYIRKLDIHLMDGQQDLMKSQTSVMKVMLI